MKVIRITTLFLSVLIVFSVFIMVTERRGYAFDQKNIQDAKSAARNISYQLVAERAGYYGYSLKCIQDDILTKKNNMADPIIQQKAVDCISYYKTGFQNLQSKYDTWETKSRSLRDAVEAEK